MTIAISSRADHSVFAGYSIFGWGLLLNIAYEFAFDPKSPIEYIPPSEGSDEGYESTTAEVAAEIAAALQRALLDKEGFVDTLERHFAESEGESYQPLLVEERDSAFEAWGRHAEKVIEVCSRGAFYIS